ncbi:MAG: PD40 domain-containing protein [Armatimonadetes bacterium]|nr:PD40 domain-containing protein [Armatimonadota bacterium]
MRPASFVLTLVFIFGLAVAGPAQLGGVTVRVSISSISGEPENDHSVYPSISGDGRYVAFESYATNLVPLDTNGFSDVFVRDMVLGPTERVSVSTGGVQGDLESHYPSISGDGRYVAFESYATNLVPGDTNVQYDVFVRDMVLGTTERVSVSTGGAQGDGGSLQPSISADGRYVAFSSGAKNLVPGDMGGDGIFVRDRVLGTTERVSVSTDGVQADKISASPSISGDGRYVAFFSYAKNLVPGDTNDRADVFVRDRVLGTTERVSVSTDGVQANSDCIGDSISGDGGYVVFKSDASNLVPGDTNVWDDIFVRDRVLGTTERVSVSTGGVQGNSFSGTIRALSISEGGRYVTWTSSASNLVPLDTNGFADVFVRDRVLGTTERVSVSTGGVQGNNGSGDGVSISGNGRYVAFDSWAWNLVHDDTNWVVDIFLRDTGHFGDTKALEDGAGVVISAITATGSFSGSFYIEAADRACGIKVAWPGAVTEGDRYRVDGTLATDETSGERFIDAWNVRLVDTLPVYPLGLGCMFLGGGDTVGQIGVAGGIGLNNIALLVRAWGAVTQIGGDYLYINDGSNLKDGTTTGAAENVGVRVICDPTGYSTGDYVAATGISSCFKTPSGKIARRLLTRRTADVSPVSGP